MILVQRQLFFPGTDNHCNNLEPRMIVRYLSAKLCYLHMFKTKQMDN